MSKMTPLPRVSLSAIERAELRGDIHPLRPRPVDYDLHNGGDLVVSVSPSPLVDVAAAVAIEEALHTL